jgi:DNA-binding MarR family transcriptional regulator
MDNNSVQMYKNSTTSGKEGRPGEETPNRHLLLPYKVLMAKHISNNAKLTYAFLYRQAGKTGDYHPDLEKLADDVGVAPSTVQRYLWALHRAGFIDLRLHVWRTTLKI